MNTRKSPKRTSDGQLKTSQTSNKWNASTNLAQKLRGNQLGSKLDVPNTNLKVESFKYTSDPFVPNTNRTWRSHQQGRKNQNYSYKTFSDENASNGIISSSSNHSYKRQKNPYHHQFDPRSWIKDDELSNKLTNSLIETLSEHGLFEDDEGTETRKQILKDLQSLLLDWSRSIYPFSSNKKECSLDQDISKEVTASSSKNLTDESNQDHTMESIPCIRLISFGSFRLGVHSPSADLDVLALCPPYVSKEYFFCGLVKVLQMNKRITGINAIPTAYTPVIKFYMDGLPIDMLYANVHDGNKLLGSTIQSDNEGSIDGDNEEFTIDDSLLCGLDEPSVRSLNGVRVAQYLLHFIPNKELFRIVLKTVKQWARVHGLYSNVLGFLGGINWAILVAWVCKRNPDAPPTVLLKIFFRTFSRWNWPKPIILTQSLKIYPPAGISPLNTWDPTTNARDGLHIMPIITPCYPSMNSSYNVGHPQLRRLSEEMFRADKVLNSVAMDNGVTWSDLLKKNDFFTAHAHYLQVTIIANNEEDHQSWFGFCESRLRILIAGMDSQTFGMLSYPFAQFFRNDDSHENVKSTYFYIALRFEYGVENVDTTSCTQEFLYMVNTWEGRKAGMDIKLEHVLQRNLPSFVFDNSLEGETSASSKITEKQPVYSEQHREESNENMHLSTPSKKTKTN